MFKFVRESRDKAPEGDNLGRLVVEAHDEMARISSDYKSDNYDKYDEYFRKPEVWEEIKDIYTACIKKQPDNFVLHFYLVRYAFITGQYDIAEREYDLFMKSTPDFMTKIEYCNEINYRIVGDYLKFL